MNDTIAVALAAFIGTLGTVLLMWATWRFPPGRSAYDDDDQKHDETDENTP